MRWGALLLPHHNSWVVKLIFANALAAPRLRFSHRACVRAQGERCVSDAAGEEATCSDTEWDIAAGFGREGVLMGEGSGAGAAGGTRGARSSRGHTALPKHPRWQTAAREGSHLGNKCRSRLRDRERRLGTWLHRKGLSSQLAARSLPRGVPALQLRG